MKRFGIARGLILVLAAAGLVAVVIWLPPHLRRRSALNELEATDSVAVFEPPPSWLTELAGDQIASYLWPRRPDCVEYDASQPGSDPSVLWEFPTIRVLGLNNVADPDALIGLSRLPKIVSLRLEHCAVNGEVLSRLPANIVKLGVFGCQWNAKDNAVAIQLKRLSFLEFQETPLDRTTLTPFSGLVSLSQLMLCPSNNASVEEVLALFEARNLARLGWHGGVVDWGGLFGVLARYPKLELVVVKPQAVVATSTITDATPFASMASLRSIIWDAIGASIPTRLVEGILSLPNLEELAIENGVFSADAFSRLHAVSAMEYLTLAGGKLPENFAAIIPKLTGLHSLGLRGCNVGNDALLAALDLPEIEWLDFRETEIDEAVVESVRSKPRTALRWILVSDSAFSEEQLAELRRRLPGVDVGEPIGKSPLVPLGPANP